MARHSDWTRAKHPDGLERPHLWGLSAAQRLRGVAPAHTFVEKRISWRGGIGMLLAIERATKFSHITAASPGKFATNAESCSVRFVSRCTGDRKCTALVNVEVMLIGLRPTGRDDRANTRLTANAEPQRRDSSRSIGRILMWKKLSVFNQKQRTCRRKNGLSRT